MLEPECDGWWCAGLGRGWGGMEGGGVVWAPISSAGGQRFLESSGP